MTRRIGPTLALGGMLLASVLNYPGRASAQAPAQPPTTPAAAAATATLAIGGDVTTPLSLSPADLKAMPRTKVVVKNEDGQTLNYEGVLVGEILKRAGVALGPQLRGNAVVTYLVASAADGYQALYSIGEVDPGLTSNDIIVADTVDGKALFDYQGPLRLVAPKDTRGARSVRMLQRIDVVRVKR